jgi:hypothetical protein
MSQELLIASLVFLLVSSPQMYRATSGLLGSWVANANGSPSTTGLLLHAAVFGAIVFLATPRKSEGYLPAGYRINKSPFMGHNMVALDPAKMHKGTDGTWRKNAEKYGSGEVQWLWDETSKTYFRLTNPSKPTTRDWRRYG